MAHMVHLRSVIHLHIFRANVYLEEATCSRYQSHELKCLSMFLTKRILDVMDAA
jgi:hypothetical protein